MDIFLLLTIVIIVVAVFATGFLFLKNKKLKKNILDKENEIKNKEKEMTSKMYELAILKELGDRVGYSLDVHEIIDVITGSLHQFIDYCAVSYVLIEPEKLLFRVHLEKSVHRGFIDDIRDRMLKSLS